MTRDQWRRALYTAPGFFAGGMVAHLIWNLVR